MLAVACVYLTAHALVSCASACLPLLTATFPLTKAANKREREREAERDRQTERLREREREGGIQRE